MSNKITRRGMLGVSAAVVGGGLWVRHAQAQSQQVVVCGWGGSLLAAQRTHYFEPFEKQGGVRVVPTGEPSVARIKAMVEAGNVEWDVVQVSLPEMITLQRANLLEPIDYSGFQKQELDGLLPAVVKSHGVGTMVVAQAVTFNTRAFPAGNRPASWADAWNVQRFPGPRCFTAMDAGARPLEIPLLADGVSPQRLYPLDVDRAFKALDRIRPHVVKWGARGVNPAELIASGDAAIGNVAIGRAISMKAEGAPIDFDFNQALQFPDLWVIPRGSKNVRNAQRFIQFASGARVQAAFSAAYPAGPVNRGAFAHLTPQQTALLSTAPGVVEKTVVVDADWWNAVDASNKSNVEKVAERWRKWIL
jgi:putative spermidine/putrescine transport system substrate-binding protein